MAIELELACDERRQEKEVKSIQDSERVPNRSRGM
jgi:hypothetical protein